MINADEALFFDITDEEPLVFFNDGKVRYENGT